MRDKLFEALTSFASRRGFLQRTAQAAGAIGFAVLGVDIAKADTVHYLCCDLCKLPSSCTYANCACEWSWTCPHTDGCTYSCKECYSGAPCEGCATNICSKAVVVPGTCPPPPPPPPPFGCFWPCTTPIILDVSGRGFHLTNADQGVLFDIRGDGQPVQIAWTAPGAGNAFLVLPDSDGLVHNGTQLFGNFTSQPPTADPNGFAALAVYDDPANGGNGDGVIDSRDAIFSSLRLWIDADHDGVCRQEELHTLPSLGVNSISLRFHLSRREDRYGNVFRYCTRVNGRDPDGSVGPKAFDVILLHL